MKIKAHMFRLNPIQLCLAFLLLLSGVSQIWGQTTPNPNDKTTQIREQKADELKTPGKTERGLNTDKTNQKDDSLRVIVEVEKNLNQDNQLQREGVSTEKNISVEIEQSEKKLTLVVTEDVAEYQSTD